MNYILLILVAVAAVYLLWEIVEALVYLFFGKRDILVSWDKKWDNDHE
jgi:hypothetical protein